MTMEEFIAFDGLFGSYFTALFMFLVVRPMVWLYESHVEREIKAAEERHEYIGLMGDDSLAQRLKCLCVDINNHLFNTYDKSDIFSNWWRAGVHSMPTRDAINQSIIEAKGFKYRTFR